MSGPHPEFIQEVLPRMDVLRTALDDLQAQEEGAAERVRRIARSILSLAQEWGVETVHAAALEVEPKDGEALVMAGEELFRVLLPLTHAAGEEPSSGIPVLIVEDDSTTAHILENVLRARGRTILVAPTAAEAWAILEREDVGLILLDLFLPDADGRDLIIRMREDPRTEAIPIVVLSGASSEDTMAECLAFGADDYLEKPVSVEEVRVVTGRQLRRAREGEGEPLTGHGSGVLSRSGFRERLEEALKGATRGEAHVLALLEMEATRGEDPAELDASAGGDLLGRAARKIRTQLRDEDALAKLEGYRLGVLLPGLPLPEAKERLEQARDALEEESVSVPGEDSVTLAFSCGLISLSGISEAPKALLKAEHLLFVARGAGGRLVVMDGDEPDLPPRTVLLVEDDSVTAAIIQHRLAKDGMEVVHYKDGREALQALAELEMDLAIFDVKLPGMDGFELLERGREGDHLQDVPVVMLTSMGRESDIVRGFALGASDYVLKPFSPVELVARIHRLLERR